MKYVIRALQWNLTRAPLPFNPALFVTTVLTLPTCPGTSYNFVRIFCNDPEAIPSRISALCPGGQTFPSETHLKEFTNHIQLVKMI